MHDLEHVLILTDLLLKQVLVALDGRQLILHHIQYGLSHCLLGLHVRRPLLRLRLGIPKSVFLAERSPHASDASISALVQTRGGGSAGSVLHVGHRVNRSRSSCGPVDSDSPGLDTVSCLESLSQRALDGVVLRLVNKVVFLRLARVTPLGRLTVIHRFLRINSGSSANDLSFFLLEGVSVNNLATVRLCHVLASLR